MSDTFDARTENSAEASVANPPAATEQTAAEQQLSFCFIASMLSEVYEHELEVELDERKQKEIEKLGPLGRGD
ncbi:MAG: hypothetical protein R3E01_35060 [Pirellulaceae bacterium]|nr:hypothetical protein [Planctomycetales bacterium]